MHNSENNRRTGLSLVWGGIIGFLFEFSCILSMASAGVFVDLLSRVVVLLVADDGGAVVVVWWWCLFGSIDGSMRYCIVGNFPVRSPGAPAVFAIKMCR
jgi:hypothetical protein